MFLLTVRPTMERHGQLPNGLSVMHPSSQIQALFNRHYGNQGQVTSTCYVARHVAGWAVRIPKMMVDLGRLCAEFQSRTTTAAWMFARLQMVVWFFVATQFPVGHGQTVLR
jgi:hypothetical protein